MVYRFVAGFLASMCINECVDKADDYFLKPVVCLAICGTASVVGLKVTYDNVGPAYSRISSVVKPFIKGYFFYKTGTMVEEQGAAGGKIGNLPPVRNIAAEIARNGGLGF
jgi:hypothetical protein